MGIFLSIIQILIIIATFFLIYDISKEKDLDSLLKKRHYGISSMILSYIILLVNVYFSEGIVISINFVYVLSFFGLILGLSLIVFQTAKELNSKYERDMNILKEKYDNLKKDDSMLNNKK